MSSRPIRGAARLAAILDALPDALLLVNSNGTVVDANHAAVQSLQAPGTSLVGMGVLDLLPEFDPSRIPGSMRPAPREADELDRPVRMSARRTDGTTFPVEVSGNDFADDGASEGRGYALSPLVPYDPYREGSRPSGSDLLLLLVRDLSSRLGVEAELRRQHKQTEMILRAAAEGVLGVDLEGRCVLVNPAAAHILEYRASELGGRELHPLIQHSRADGTPLNLEESALLDTLTSGRKHRVRGTVLWRKDGRPVTVDLTTAPVRDGDQLVGAVMTFTDRTRELALVARNEHLTAVLESELGGALTTLHRRIDALAGDPAGQLWPEANWTLRRLADECRRFGKLIDGVLSYQRFEAGTENGQGTLEREPVGLDAVVRQAVERAGELVGSGRVRFSVHAAPVEVIADRERLAQALAHLVADVSGVALSLDAGPAATDGPVSGTPALPPVGGDAPMVVLAAAQRGEVARIEIRGPGLGGSPVHLPIARSTVERHGGVLQRHELPNRAGTTYVVELPLDPVAAKAAAERAAAGGRRDAPKESDTAVLPDLPGIPELLPTASPTQDAPGSGSAGPADAAGAAGATRPGGAEPGAGTGAGVGASGAGTGAGSAMDSGEPADGPATSGRAERAARRAAKAAAGDPGDTGAGRPAAGHDHWNEAPPRPDGGPEQWGGADRPPSPEQWNEAPGRPGQSTGGAGRAVPEQWNGNGNDPAYGRPPAGAPHGPEADPWRGDDGSGTAYAVPAGPAGDERDRAAPEAGESREARPAGPIALGPGPSGQATPTAPAAPTSPPQGEGGEPSARGPIALGAGPVEAPPAQAEPGPEQAQPSGRRRALPAQDDSSGGFSIPGVPDAGTPLYPGLENALPAGPAPALPEPAPAQPTGRRRRLAVPPGGEAAVRPDEQPGRAAQQVGPQGNPQGLPPDGQGQQDGSPQPGVPGSAPAVGSALEPARPALPAASTGPQGPGVGGAEPEQPQPVGSGLGELAPPRPMGAGGAFAGAFPAAFPATEAPEPPAPQGAGQAGSQVGAPGGMQVGMQVGAPVESRTPPRPMAELAAAGSGEPALPAPADDPTMVAPAVDGRPRRLLVWPEPDPSTKQALQDRGYRPVIVRSREEVEAQAAAYPAALFVDPLTGPITRTALQSLRTAALNSRVPVLVTAGLGQATREAAYGADPAVLLRALAPRDGENHAPRVLLVEGNPDIAAAMISSLERRGMHVEHAVDENEAVARASSVQPNLVVMDLLQIRRRRVGLLDWLRANDRLHRTPLVVYTSTGLDPRELPRLRTGETVLFLAERATTADVQSRIVDLLGRIGTIGEQSVPGMPAAGALGLASGQ
ncbi:PAS domain-containing protein [Kitasatospora sp. NPDC050543]|uniref:hybrid sensor histidine kinase/response regulator n=1 Tax=Kitasatospora sp. NPDC050543 TaxID=3364054 RepID=UPI00378A59E9